MTTIENATRQVGQAYGTLPMIVLGMSLGDLVDEYLALQGSVYQEAILSMRLTEAGVLRALVTVLSGKAPPEPEGVEAATAPEEPEIPGWWLEYQEANPEVSL